jgi:serine/threonine kinase PknH
VFGIHRRLKVALHFPDVGGLVGGVRLAAVVTAGTIALVGCSTTPTTSQVTSTPTTTARPTTSQATSPPTTTSPPTVSPDRLGSILLTPAEADTIMGATGLQDQGGFSGTDTNVFTVSNPDCLGAAHVVQSAVYSDSGYTVIKVDVLHEPGNRYTHEIEQAVASFPSADQALAFVKASAPKWKACAGQIVGDAINGNNTQWTFGNLVGDVPKIALLYSKQRARGWTCQRALSGVLNLVIDVKACGYHIDSQGLQVVDQIAAKATQ